MGSPEQKTAASALELQLHTIAEVWDRYGPPRIYDFYVPAHATTEAVVKCVLANLTEREFDLATGVSFICKPRHLVDPSFPEGPKIVPMCQPNVIRWFDNRMKEKDALPGIAWYKDVKENRKEGLQIIPHKNLPFGPGGSAFVAVC